MAKKKKAPTWDALVIRTANKDRRSHGGFQWPESGIVECPDWKPTQSCGNGLHGLIDGVGNYALLSTEHDAVWQILRVVRSECIEIDGKVKFPRCEVVYSGTMHGALTRISAEWIRLAIQSNTATTGNCAHAATTGAKSIAAALGIDSKAKAGPDGAIVLSRWDGNRYRLKVGYVGEDIKRDTWYRLNDNHEFEECEG